MYPESDSERRGAPDISSYPRVLVVGAGALGCAALRTLVQGSVTVTLVDDDRVELSNLQRQVLYGDADIGSFKVDAAAASLAREFRVRISASALRFHEQTGPALVAGADIVIDATDDPPTKFLISRLCVDANTPYIYAGVARTGGQWMLVVPGRSACLECAFPAREGIDESAAGCAALGILAPVAGLVGSMQAVTALAFLRGGGRAKPGRLHTYELTGARSRHIDFTRDPACYCSGSRGGAGESGSIAAASRRTS